MNARQHFAAIALLLAASAPAGADVISRYTAPGGSFAPTTAAARVTASALNALGSAADLQPGAALPDSVFLQQLVASPTPAAAVANNQYFQFSAAADPGYALNFSSLTFNAGKGGSSSPRGWVLRSSLDGFGSTIATADITSIQPTLTPYSIDLSGAGFQNLASEVTLRLYDYAPTAGGVGMFYDDITLNGSVTTGSLVRYEAPGGSFSPTIVAPHVIAAALTDIGSAADLQPGAALPTSGFVQQLVASPTRADAVSNNQFFEFAVGPDAGFEMDLTGLHFDAGRGGSSTPRGWVLRSSVDGFASDIATAEIPTVQPALTSFDVSLLGVPYQDLVSPVTFRIYGYAPTAGGVGLFYDNLNVTGFINAVAPVPGDTSVPEPVALCLLGIGLAGVLRFSRYRKTPRRPVQVA